MSGLRARLTDALRDHLIHALSSPMIDFDYLAGVLLSLPGIAIVDLSNVDPIAEALAWAWPESFAKAWPWDTIPENAREHYRNMARAALLAAANAAEDRT